MIHEEALYQVYVPLPLSRLCLIACLAHCTIMVLGVYYLIYYFSYTVCWA